MEFKYLAVGSELYGNVHELDPSLEDESPHIERKVTHFDTNSGIEYAFNSQRLTNILNEKE